MGFPFLPTIRRCDPIHLPGFQHQTIGVYRSEDGGSKERERIGYDSVPWQSGSSARVFYCVFTTEKRLGELLGITKK